MIRRLIIIFFQLTVTPSLISQITHERDKEGSSYMPAFPCHSDQASSAKPSCSCLLECWGSRSAEQEISNHICYSNLATVAVEPMIMNRGTKGESVKKKKKTSWMKYKIGWACWQKSPILQVWAASVFCKVNTKSWPSPMDHIVFKSPLFLY